ncbi:segment polarity protein dishevelled homolog DVL-3-like isoform X5 [Symsagittifera roscoffensis]|uniref:segment polarity protein dishevelled homolog DVL-3-like isoform X5 n=1 Tax=Symsagittifera roscoffensis TaxID=84072 RepID=UPI00307BE37F
MAAEETKIIYHIDGEETPYLVKIPLPSERVTLADFKAAVNKPNFKYFFKQMDADFGFVKEEINDESTVLPEYNGRVVSWLEPAKGSDGSASDGGSMCTESMIDHHLPSPGHPTAYNRPLAPPVNDGDLTTETESVMSAALPSRRPGQRLNGQLMGAGMRGGNSGLPMNRGGYDSSILTSECETNSMLDTTDDDAATTRFSSSTGGNLPSRLMGLPGGRQRPQRKKKKKPFQRRVNGRANSFSSITDSTMSLNIITVTLSMETTSFLGISIVGQTHKQGDGGIYVGTIMPGGAVAQDGRIEPGDMILQVNEYSFENMSNDDAVKILRDVVVRPGPIKLVVAKCWNPNPQSYLSLPKANDHMSQQLRSTAGDPQSWVEQASRMMNYKGGGPGGGGSGPISPSLASVTSDGSLSSSLPESSIIYPGRADSTNYLLAAITGAPPPSASGAPTFSGGGPGGQMGNMISGGGSGGGSVGTPGSGGPGQMVGPNGTPIFGMSSADYHQQQQQQENMGGAMGMGMIGGHHLSTKTDVLTVLRAVQMPNSGLEIKDRMWLKITIPNAFLGHSLVDWLFEHLDGFSVRRDAHKYASRLLKDGFIKHTTGKASFSEQCYYIFNSEHAITNMNNLSYPGDNSNAGANLKQRERDPLEVDEENDVLAPLPYASPWGAPQYMGYQPRTAGYQGNQPLPPPPMGHPGAGPQGAFTVNELDSFGPMGMGGMSHQQMPMVSSAQQQQLMSNGGHSSPAGKPMATNGSSNSSNRSGVGQNHSHSHNGNRAASGGTGSSNKIPLCGGGGGLSDSLSDLDCSASQRMGPTHSNSSEYFVDPM